MFSFRFLLSIHRTSVATKSRTFFATPQTYRPNIRFTNTDDQAKIQTYIDDANVKELTALCFSFFKTEQPIDSTKTIKKIINRTVQLLDDIDPLEPDYSSIIKSLRYSSKIKRWSDCLDDAAKLIRSVAEHCNGEIIFSSPYNMIQTIKFMEAWRIYDEKLIDKIIDRFFAVKSNCRIKDVQYILTSLSNFNYTRIVKNEHCKQLLKSTIDDVVDSKILQPTDEAAIKKQDTHLLPLLRALTILGFYHENFIHYVNNSMRDPDTLRFMLKAFDSKTSILLAHVATRIEKAKVKLDFDPKVFENSKEFGALPQTRVANMGSVKKDSSNIDHLEYVLSKIDDRFSRFNIAKVRRVAEALSKTSHLRDECYKLTFQRTFAHNEFSDLVITKNHDAPGSSDSVSLLPQPVKGTNCVFVIFALRTDYVDGYVRRLSGFKSLIKRLCQRLGYKVIVVDLELLDDAERLESFATNIKTILDHEDKGVVFSSLIK